ncbi:MAG: hypothetical protein A3H25_03870 [Sphingomonadales bacterium RIFCSPLOWO2_12_FULL_63_15]|nr:MAG: hypothetical protein A3H25_03870 [Sphingomonadales bacterium RIFCSPLOWO2_12_FULL_63_15]
MGGYGSGRHCGRPTAEASFRLDLAWVLRTGRAKEGDDLKGTLSWSRRGEHAGSIGYKAMMSEPGKERLELSYSRGSGDDRQEVSQTVTLCFTRPHYGGKRWWMICPYRGIRVGKLYLPPGGDRFASRTAWRLGYHIQRVARHDRASERLFRLQAKLGCDMGLDAFPRRPKGMWQRTYARHLALYWELDEAADAEMTMALARIMGRFG